MIFVKNKILKGIDIIIRSLFYIIMNYLFISMGLSFHAHWISILFSTAMIWKTIEYGKSIHELTRKKTVTAILCIGCIAASTFIAYFVGYIQGTIVSF